MVSKMEDQKWTMFSLENEFVQSLLRQVIHIPQESPENIKLNNWVNSVTQKNPERNWPVIQRQRKWCFLCPRLVEDWLIESRLAKVSIYFLVCVAMCCQTAQENAALKQYFFLQNKSTCLGIKKNRFGGNSHDPPCARLKINGTVTSHKPGKRKKHR